ncbi:type II toxin-antitoxin system HicB family antitoxin [Flavobacterium piscisymbiosum]|uniref:Type II toxin-antitoxin system HicB family antitoxin n=1 Tax=Flavobacterium piscisymbiosum TaxID=2893753 RepID=A0ABS8MEL9_9FLAO|nr:type II toxin-antitoxin system HicB family antitoxin [Flavobacterium sp. F-30]MCC9063955.1 type II toxin-antitoxin system HicB family antitoxin [Flavobacterium sp. F-30]
MNAKKIVISVVIEKTSTGFSAYAKEIDGLATVGSSITEIKENFNEVLQYHVEYLQEQGETVTITDFEISYQIDLEQVFDYFSVINKSAFAEHYAEMNQSLFRQYTKGLANLSSDKMLQISKGLHKLADELSDLTLV